MPLYEFRCDNDHIQEHYLLVDARNSMRINCLECGKLMKRMPGGNPMLFFEEGRGRWIHNLGHEPIYITSKKQHREAMKKAGMAEAPAIPEHTKSTGRLSEKGRWL